MASKSIVRDTGSECRHPRVVLSRPDSPMVQTHFVCKGPRLPPLHSRGDHGYMVYAATHYWHISTDLLEALASEQLTRAGYVLDADKAVVIDSTLHVLERRPHHPQ